MILIFLSFFLSHCSADSQEFAKQGYIIWLSGNFNKYDEALKYFIKAGKEDPYNAEYISASGRILFEMGRNDEAYKKLVRVFDLKPKAWIKAWTCLCMGEIFEKRGNYNKAIAYYEEAIKQNSTDNSSKEAMGRKILAQWKHKYTEHFIIAYPQGGVAEKEIENIIKGAEDKYNYISLYTGIKFREKIQWYLFPSSVMGYEIMAMEPEFSRPQVKQLYTVFSWNKNLFNTPQLGLVMAFRLGKTRTLDPLFQWGFAGFLENRDKDYKSAVLNLKISGKFISLSNLRKDFYAPSSDVAFNESSSFIQFLINTYGLEKFKKIWIREDIDKAIKEVYGKKFKDLEREWYKKAMKKK